MCKDNILLLTYLIEKCYYLSEKNDCPHHALNKNW